MKKELALIWGVLSFLPGIYLLGFVASFRIALGSSASNLRSPLFSQYFFLVHGAVMLLAMALVTGSIVFLFRSNRIREEQKALWAIVLFMGYPISAPIFWYLYVWPASQRTPEADHALSGDLANGTSGTGLK